MPGERSHAIGREGVLRAKELLARLLGSNVVLLFNAYDHSDRLTFTDPMAPRTASFTFDLGGGLRRPNARRFAGEESVALLAEVKSVARGGDLLNDYREFLRRAAIASSTPENRQTWFIFLAAVPFGVSEGARLWDGAFLSELLPDWPAAIASSAAELTERTTVLMATASLERLLGQWGATA